MKMKKGLKKEKIKEKYFTAKKENKGITLMTLAITIIVLLILGGISIAMLTGQNGIIQKANKAKKLTELSNAREKVDIEILRKF